MDVARLNSSGRDKLYRSLQSYTRSLNRMSVRIIVQAHSDKVGQIDITVNGKRGLVTKNIIVTFDTLLEEWCAITDGYEIHMTSLSEIAVLVRQRLTKMSVMVNRI